MKSLGQASWLETQEGVDATVLRPNFLFCQKSQFLLLRPSADWMMPTQYKKLCPSLKVN